ncbi:tRNA uracil 4-sulfurtransferase ThiI [Sneathia vaginalis]|jgi:thiamine biosynthesis/tRNA modification protein thiI|uniref:tRNA uracil 4-sulfurtransferase ThiI n=1 Tax=Sneathia TaxID=168808 RepID=UPI001868C63B|nr:MULTISPECIES: tRNA uracil 4-sulfurtransferase ThiI [Sneathia]MBE3031337.1 tRNA 4-thiouridine(8) synthase ThiI [Sneathia sp. DSM 16631]MDK9582499.1 tRNA uracil 4-sulfurtransferase ThiI [Sneathia vaginalis]
MNINITKIDAIGLGYGELVLKGKNRGTFERNIKKRLKNKLNNLSFETTLSNDMSKEFILLPKGNAKEVLEAIKNVFGINSLFLTEKVEKDIDKIKEKVLEVANEVYDNGAKNFKVEVNRADKTFPINSIDFAKELGGHILVNSKFTDVKMKDPDLLIYVDIRKDVYVYTEKRKAYGGLPLGSAGHGLSLISGGIDSPVASFLMAKRGMKMSYVTFHSFPFTSQKALDKIEELVRILTQYNGASAFFKMNILKMQDAIKKYTNVDYTTILTRRCMMKLAQRLANENEYKALVTGESLGQVASQTLCGLTCTNASVDLPVFRPLIGQDKIEIMEKASEIGTYEKSIEPYEDSCSMFAPKHPVTNPKIEDVLREEAKIENYDEIMNEIYMNKEMVIVR